MKLAQALVKIKNLKGKFSKINTAIEGAAMHFEDSEPEFNYVDERSARTEVSNAIRELKTKVAVTNALTKVEFEGKEITLTELIMINADVRAELAFLNKMLELDPDGSSLGRRYLREQRTKDTIRTIFAEGFSKKDLRKEVEKAEARKEIIEQAMAQANVNTELVG